MKHSVRVCVCENLPNERAKLLQILDKNGCLINWISDTAIDQIEEGHYDLALKEIKDFRPNCLIIDLALTDREQKQYEDGMGKEHFYFHTKLSGGFDLIEEVVKNNLLPWNKIAIWTQFAESDQSGAELGVFVNNRFGSPISFFQKEDAEDKYRLFDFVWSSVNIHVNNVYFLISNASENTRSRIVGDLNKLGKDFGIKWRTISRVSLREAEKKVKYDKILHYDLIFIDLSLSEEDKIKFEEIKQYYVPTYNLDDFTPLKFAIKLKNLRKTGGPSVLIYLTEIEKRSLVSYLLSEAEGDWAVKRSSLSISLVSILIKLFLKINRDD